jgi:hypothetical protein
VSDITRSIAADDDYGAELEMDDEWMHDMNQMATTGERTEIPKWADPDCVQSERKPLPPPTPGHKLSVQPMYGEEHAKLGVFWPISVVHGLG